MKPKHILRTYLGFSSVNVYYSGSQGKFFGVTYDKDSQDQYRVILGPSAFKTRHDYLDTIVHELTHVLEYHYMHDKKRFDPTQYKACSKLARTVGAGIGEMLARMYVKDKKTWVKLTRNWP